MYSAYPNLVLLYIFLTVLIIVVAIKYKYYYLDPKLVLLYICLSVLIIGIYFFFQTEKMTIINGIYDMNRTKPTGLHYQLDACIDKRLTDKQRLCSSIQGIVPFPQTEWNPKNFYEF